MDQSRLLNLVGADSCLLYCLRDVSVDPGTLVFAQLNIHASQNVDGVRHCLPVEGGVLSDIQIQVLIQSRYRLLRTSNGISRVNLIISIFIADIQIGISEYGNQLDLAGLQIHAADHVYVGVSSLSYVHLAALFTGIHSKTSDHPMALHLGQLLLA